jgi:cyclopropane fatty-acyl-phospholipid synthase-like methyltransferase
MYDFNEVYRSGAPWEIGRPQPALVEIVESGEVKPCRILDAGCGSGELSLYLAGKGFDVTGMDISDRAIGLARKKAIDRGLKVEFIVRDVLKPDEQFTDIAFDTVVDTGLYHVIDDANKPFYLRQVHKALKPSGQYFMLCFSDKETAYGGPKRVSMEEIEKNFSGLFRIRYIHESYFIGRLQDGHRKAYLVSAVKVP